MRKTLLLTLGVVAAALATASHAHTPLCSCYDNGDDTIVCEGGFSDGSSAAGVEMRVLDDAGNLVLSGKMSEDSEFELDKPKGEYKIVFDADPGHRVEIDGADIVE